MRTMRITAGLKLSILLPAAMPLLSAAGAAAAPACRDSAGAAHAQRYVTQCLQVSPATHPPCNAANPCGLIVDEIRRGCALLTTGAPPFCASYKQR